LRNSGKGRQAECGQVVLLHRFGDARVNVRQQFAQGAQACSLGAADILGAFNQSQVLLQAEIKGIVQREFQDRAAGFAGGNAAGERGRKLAQVLAEWIHITHRLP